MTHQSLVAPSINRVPGREKQLLLAKLGGEVSRVFASAGMPIQKRFSRMLDAGCEAFQADRGFVTINDAKSVKVRYANSAFEGALPIVSHDPLSAWIVAHRLPLTINGGEQTTIDGFRKGHDHPPARFIGAPIIFDGQVFGTLEFSGMQSDLPPFGDMDLAMIQMLCVITAAPMVLLAMS